MQRAHECHNHRLGPVGDGNQLAAYLGKYRADLGGVHVSGHALPQPAKGVDIGRQLGLTVPGLELAKVVLDLQALRAGEVDITVEVPVGKVRRLVVENFQGAAGRQEAGQCQHTDNPKEAVQPGLCRRARRPRHPTINRKPHGNPS